MAASRGPAMRRILPLAISLASPLAVAAALTFATPASAQTAAPATAPAVDPLAPPASAEVPLEDIRRLLALWRDRSRASAEVKQLALQHVEALEAKAAALAAVAESLRHLAQHCAGDDRPECPILAELEGASA